jgi:hypothetical protein
MSRFKPTKKYDGIEYVTIADISVQLGVSIDVAREWFSENTEVFNTGDFKIIFRTDQVAMMRADDLSDEDILERLFSTPLIDYYFTEKGYYRFLCMFFVKKPGKQGQTWTNRDGQEEKEGITPKFLVINYKYLDALLVELPKLAQDFMSILQEISKYLPDNNYYVCNCDEPYAQEVIRIILDGEKAKAEFDKAPDGYWEDDDIHDNKRHSVSDIVAGCDIELAERHLVRKSNG